ncbi:Protein AATF [Trichoplax sp. H2]|nr:Protein AATF [Trichoplax sp. H2]|eukprot:RDD39775.1 Protein AATF [Trichoplax sp. H2]
MSLKEQIEKLQNPAPLFDPEEDYWNESSAAKLCHASDPSGDHDGNGDEGLAASRLIKSKKGPGNVAFLDQIDKKYQGSTVSRNDIHRQREEYTDEDEESLSESEQDSELQSSLDGDSDQDLSQSDDESNELMDLQTANDDQDEDSAQGASEEDENVSERGDEEAVDTSEEDDDEIQNFTQGDADGEIEKGEATKAQLQLWDCFMDWRIQMQSVVQVANQLPQFHIHSNFIECGGKTFQTALHKCKSSVASLLSELLVLQEQLMQQYPETRQLLLNSSNKALAESGDVKDSDDDDEIPSDDETVHGIKSVAKNSEECSSSEMKEEESDSDNSIKEDKRKSRKRRFQGNYDEVIDKRASILNKFRGTAIKKWSDRTQIAFGKLNSKKFSDLDQSVPQQIQKILSDKERLIKRTQLRRIPIRALGNLENNDSRDKDARDSHLKDYDPEIFDDSDFYHQLLRELIEYKSTFNKDSDPLAMGRQWLQFQQLRSKVKRKVDTKASKGRKLRYDVHDKLISFAAPMRQGTWTDTARNNLCASLFGKQGTKHKSASNDLDGDIVLFR